jgi:DNA replication protein DnaC
LQLSYIGNNFDALVVEAKQTKQPYDEFIRNALTKELEQRKENRMQRRIKEARFPFKKYLQGMDLDWYEKEIRNEIEDLCSLDFISEKRNVILVSNPGRGKTHLAIGLGIAACLADKRVLFTNVPNLIIELKEAMSRSEISAYKRKFEKFDLVIVDELGYVSFDRAGADILFNLLSNRNGTGSMIITTNLSFARWQEVFIDPDVTGALVDRLAHLATVLDMSGDSIRINETKQWLKGKGFQ